MRSRSLFVVVVAACLIGTPMSASVFAAPSGGIDAYEEMHIDINDEVRDELGSVIGYRMDNLFVQVRRGVDASGSSTASVRATGFTNVWYFDETGHTSAGFPWQDVDAAAVVGDPAGNSLTFAATLYQDPTAQSGGRAFDLTLSKPTTTYVEHPDTHNPGVNAWVDPNGEAGANAYARVGIRRMGYEVSGIFADDPLTSGPGTFASTFHGVLVSPSISAP